MEIRELNVNNIDDIKNAILNIFSKDPWNDTWTEEQLHLYVLELIENKNSLSFGFYENQNLVGISLGKVKHWCEGTEYWIEEFGILPEKQKSGLGSLFLTFIERVLKSKEVTSIVLLTENMVPAYTFYQKNGFKEQKETVFFSKKITGIARTATTRRGKTPSRRDTTRAVGKKAKTDARTASTPYGQYPVRLVPEELFV